MEWKSSAVCSTWYILFSFLKKEKTLNKGMNYPKILLFFWSSMCAMPLSSPLEESQPNIIIMRFSCWQILLHLHLSLTLLKTEYQHTFACSPKSSLEQTWARPTPIMEKRWDACLKWGKKIRLEAYVRPGLWNRQEVLSAIKISRNQGLKMLFHLTILQLGKWHSITMKSKNRILFHIKKFFFGRQENHLSGQLCSSKVLNPRLLLNSKYIEK